MESAHDLFEHEVQSMYDGARRAARELPKMAKQVSHPGLSTKIEDLGKAAEEQVRRMEEVFELLDQKPQRSESKTMKGFLDDFSSFTKEQKPESSVLDMFAAETAGNIAQYAMQSYQEMIKLAERSGANHASPKISDLLMTSMREEKKLSKDIQKLTEELVEQLRPS